jgi:7,8-dihydropterin-6-yl-methyl-4-(beta-D-ribofuranosyl)aminobenzene 5'-phosphate synthase
MTKLPPGFWREPRQHLADHPPVDEMTGVPFVDKLLLWWVLLDFI